MNAGGALSPIDRHSFYSGLLLALRQHRARFPAEGRKFYDAFRETVEYAINDLPKYRIEGAEWMDFDPVFGVVHEANEMLLEAEQDRLVALLNPQLREAQFKITKEQADRELRTIGPDADWFRTLAKRFDERLGA